MKATMHVFLALLVLAIAGGLTACDNTAFQPDSFVFVAQPANAQIGRTILSTNLDAPAPAVAVQQGKQIDMFATGSVTIAIKTNPSGGTLSGKTTVDLSNGVATFTNLSIDKPGTGYTLVATSGQFGTIVSAPFDVTMPSAAKLAFTQQPTNATAGSSISPVVAVTIEDAQGNPVTTATNAVTIAIGTNAAGGTLSGTMTVNAVAGTGVATFSNLSIDKAGTGYTLTATASGLTSATSNAFNATAPPATKVGFTQQPTNAIAGVSIAPAVTVTIEDANGNPVTTATNAVTIAIGTNPAGGTLSGTMTVNAVAGTGVATFSNLSIDKAGTGYTLTATASGLTSATSNAFNITAPSFGNGPIFTPGSVPALDDAGDTAVIGLANNAITTSTATVFVNNAGTWSQAAQLQSPTGVQSVAISGDGNTVVIGDCGNNACAGEAYVYVAPPGGWASATSPVNPTATLTASDAAVHHRIGYSVATDHAGDTIAVGAPCDFTAGTTLCGTVYVYNRNTGWVNKLEDAQLQIAGTPAGNATLGISVAMDSAGQTIVAGQSGTGNANTPGAMYVFIKQVGGWVSKSTPDATLTASTSANPVNGDALGTSISISGDGTTIVGGAPSHPSCLPKPCGGAGPGAAYVFHTQTAGVWPPSKNEDATLTAQTGHNQDQFGSSTTINFAGTTIVVTALNEPFNTTPGPGAAYVFQKNAVTGWSGPQNETQLLTAFSGNDISSNTVVPTGRFGGFSNGASLSGGGSVLAIGGQATVNGTINKQAVWLFQ